jgi:hypothetical protein
MIVTRMDGPEDSDPTEKRNPTWEDIESAIRRLDGETCTLVCLGIGEPPVPHMAIGGGKGGKYIVYSTRDNRCFYNLMNPQAAPGKCLLKAGGQDGDYDARQCVSLTDALRAAKTYAETGQIDPSLTWERQS